MIRDFIGVLWDLPYGFWHCVVLRQRKCWMIRRRGKGADLRKVELIFLSLAGVDLEGADLSHASLMEVDLHGANLANANLSHAHLLRSNFQGANLRGANLQSAGLNGADLRNADLSGADLTRASLTRPIRYMPPDLCELLTREQLHDTGHWVPNLAGADLTGARLVAADLIDADLTGTNLTEVVCDTRTRWPNGFDPSQHGVQVPPMPTEWRLLREEVVLGTLQDCRPDYSPAMPWFRCHFTPTAAFEEVRPLFAEDIRLRDEQRIEEWAKAHQEIRSLGLRLESLEGQILEPWFVRIDGEELLFRY